jgi:O-antigen ligase
MYTTWHKASLESRGRRTADTVLSGEKSPEAGSIEPGALLERLLFLSLLAVICLTAAPYGTISPWWESAFAGLVFISGAVRVAHGLLNRDPRLGGPGLLLPPLLLACYSLVQTIPLVSPGPSAGPALLPVSADPYESWRFTVKLLALIMFGELLLKYTTDRKRLAAVVNAVIVVGAASAAFGVTRYAAQQDDAVGFVLPGLTPGVGFGQFINHNHFAFLMEMSIGLAAALWVSGVLKPHLTPVYVVAMIMMWVSLILTGSRGGIFTMLIQAAVLIVVFFRARLRRLREGSGRGRLLRLASQIALACFLLTSTVVFTAVVGGDKVATRVGKLPAEVQTTGEDASAARRIDIWHSAWAMIKEHPWAGVGFGAFPVAITRHHESSGVSAPEVALNDYIELTADGGAFGAAIFCWFVVCLMRRIVRQLKSPSRSRRAACLGAAIGLMSVAVHSLVDSGLHTTINAVVFTSLVVIATVEIPEEGRGQVSSARTTPCLGGEQSGL